MTNKTEIVEWFKGLQDRICTALEDADGGAKFIEDTWERPGGGGGRTRIISDGAVLEKGGIGFSAVHGKLPEKIMRALMVTEPNFMATGVSLVIHPRSPMVPIIHMNVRYFELDNGISWFGGGIDLTPIYVDSDDAAFFHTTLKAVCDKHDESYYPRFKKWADEYFYIKHRKETRGIGGIFFDRLSANEGNSLDELFAFVQGVGDSFAPTYTWLMNKNRNIPYGQKELDWQLLRRGRYVEFNLVLDKGTKFGLDTDGRTESILMSMPPMAKWVYNYSPQEGSLEAKTSELLKKGINWV